MGLPFLMALLAAGGVLLIVWALLGTRSSDPVQARLTQLGTLEGVTSLEEIELQQPLMDRTMRPLMRRLSGIGTRLTSRERIGRTESKLAEAGYPGGLRTIDFMGLKVVAAIAISGLTFLLLGALGQGISTARMRQKRWSDSMGRAMERTDWKLTGSAPVTGTGVHDCRSGEVSKMSSYPGRRVLTA